MARGKRESCFSFPRLIINTLDWMTSNNGFYGDKILYKNLEFFRALQGSALENRRKWYGFGSSTVFQTVRYTVSESSVSESTVSDGTVAHTTVFQMVFGLASNNKGFPQPSCGVVSQGCVLYPSECAVRRGVG